MTAGEIINQLKGVKGLTDITLRINSDGGEVFEALAIYNYLKSLNANIRVYIDGIAASAATIIACAGRVFMPENAMLMIHNPWGVVQGDSDDMREQAEILDKIKESVIRVYQAKTGKEHDELAELMKSETWLSAQEAFDWKLCDAIIPAPQELPMPEPAGGAEVLDAVKAERERLKELDALMTPERKSIIMKAKYETLQSANEIALELLRLQNRREDYRDTAGVSASYRQEDADDGIKRIADIINQRRGY